MRTTKVTDNLTQLTRLGFVNAYLVREDDGYTLVDTTLAGGAGPLIAAATAAGGEIRRVVLTHGHTDHVGSVKTLAQRLGPDVPVMISDTDARILAGEWPVAGKRRGSWPNVRADFSLLAAEQRVGNLEVIPTPGHSPGHISLRDTRDGTIIAGDAFTAIGGLAVPSHLYWRFPLAATATWDRGEAIRSAQVLRALAPSLLVVGHGPATFEPLAAMDAAIHRAERAA